MSDSEIEEVCKIYWSKIDSLVAWNDLHHSFENYIKSMVSDVIESYEQFKNTKS